MFRSLVRSQQWLSAKFDLLLPSDMRVDGNSHFITDFAPPYLQAGSTVIDIGGGKNPYIGPDKKSCLQLHVVGLDVDATELAQAPPGAYDATICADIQRYRGNGDADVVICQSLLEHVENVSMAFAAIASMLKPGGKALIFVPSRNALFARLNLLLPENLKRRLLFTIFPSTRRSQGFKSYYDQCTPAAFKSLAQKNGLIVAEARLYFISSYFSFFFPAYLLWRIWILLFRAISGEQSAETFSMVLIRQP